MARPPRPCRPLAAAVLLACSAPPAAPSAPPAAPPVPVSAADPPAPAAPPAPPTDPAWRPFPTAATAGAELCRPGQRNVLGPAIDLGEPVAGFGAHGGLVAFITAERTLALQPVDRDGEPRAPLTRQPVAPDYQARHVVAVGPRFVVLLLLWDWQAARARWSALAVAADGAALGSVLELDLDDRDVSDVQALADDRLAILAGEAAIAPPARRGAPGRWLELDLAADGALGQRASDFPTRDRDGRDRFLAPANLRRAALDGRLGWLVERRDGRDPEGVWDGRRTPVAGARLLAPDDHVVARIGALDETPPPHGGRVAGGRILEPLHTPALHRSLGGRPLARVTALAVRGLDPLDNQLVWTGTRFLVVYRDHSRGDSVAVTLAIDCTP